MGYRRYTKAQALGAVTVTPVSARMRYKSLCLNCTVKNSKLATHHPSVVNDHESTVHQTTSTAFLPLRRAHLVQVADDLLGCGAVGGVLQKVDPASHQVRQLVGLSPPPRLPAVGAGQIGQVTAHDSEQGPDTVSRGVGRRRWVSGRTPTTEKRR